MSLPKPFSPTQLKWLVAETPNPIVDECMRVWIEAMLYHSCAFFNVARQASKEVYGYERVDSRSLRFAVLTTIPHPQWLTLLQDPAPHRTFAKKGGESDEQGWQIYRHLSGEPNQQEEGNDGRPEDHGGSLP